MGAISFTKTVDATNPSEGWDIIKEDGYYTKGHDRYSGDASNCDLGRQTLSFPVYNDTSRRETYEFIKNNGNGRKWVADYVDMGVKYYILRQVKVTPKKNDAKYKYQYVLRDSSGLVKVASKRGYDSYSEALEQGILHCLQVGDDVDVIVEPIKQSGSNLRATVEVIETTLDKPPRRKLNKKEKLIEMHTYCFYGWAAE